MGIAPVEPPGTSVGPAMSGDVGWAELARSPSSNHDGQAWQVSPGGQARYLRERAAGLTWRGHWSGLHGRNGRKAEPAVVGVVGCLEGGRAMWEKKLGNCFRVRGKGGDPGKA